MEDDDSLDVFNTDCFNKMNEDLEPLPPFNPNTLPTQIRVSGGRTPFERIASIFGINIDDEIERLFDAQNLIDEDEDSVPLSELAQNINDDIHLDEEQAEEITKEIWKFLSSEISSKIGFLAEKGLLSEDDLKYLPGIERITQYDISESKDSTKFPGLLNVDYKESHLNIIFWEIRTEHGTIDGDVIIDVQNPKYLSKKAEPIQKPLLYGEVSVFFLKFEERKIVVTVSETDCTLWYVEKENKNE